MDIVERLRDWNKFGVSRGDFIAYSQEAADEIERLRKDNKLAFELMDTFVKEINRLKHMIAQYKLYDDGPYLDDNGNSLDGN